MVLWSYDLLILCPIRLILMICRARGGDKSAPSLPYRILSFQILGTQNRAKKRVRLGRISNSDKFEQIRKDVMHFRKLCFPGAATQRLSLRNNSPHQTATFAYFSHTCEGKLRLCKSAGRYCSDLQKWSFGIGGVAFFKLCFLQAL